MNFLFKNAYEQNELPIVIGCPSHLNQMANFDEVSQMLNNQLEDLKKQQIISSELGVISTTGIIINDKIVKLITVGLGNLKEIKDNDYQKVYGQLSRYLHNNKIEEIQLIDDTFKSQTISDSERLYRFGWFSKQAVFNFDNYKSSKSADIETKIHFINSSSDNVETYIQQGEILGDSINLARTYSQTPPNILTPEYFANQIKNHFKDTQVSVSIKDEVAIKNEGIGLLDAVGKGSINPPRLVTLEYKGSDKDPIALVGKGVTYDSGGYQIKPKNGMPTMKYDMSGASNVVAMVNAISELQLPIHIVAVLPLAENMISNAAMKPDDVFTALSGETVEVTNTDAEGRLVLGDAVSYVKQYRPELIMNFATLTGAVVGALGLGKTGIFSSDGDAYIDAIKSAAKYSNEVSFELPITDEEKEDIRSSDVADLTNCMLNKHGKALFAAAFVTHFSGDIPHLHFDIAGSGETERDSFKGPKGATGAMIPTVLHFLKNK
ncbi:M17 family metallopeptidase [Mammaliicoccus stepanovicii]|uniref:Probable cytosol aminopeptidase n=1 Tax=Mammaliicoccus stepanovicii TaxID=643214 RepID=A0A239ZUH2_9STAP|nr:leucyl aminopeptidase family protein [Mammaliicoccus stepanovicii]PNZ77497.1 aminopeptidase [Mammaliicoccus stepanovicii]GGI38947.1 cytosol aminopeptidase [Mammaliicoccus stepanovicii]SNV74520.1 leucyl aminopeptidase [Mammaliicoccus stepanovicii]